MANIKRTFTNLFKFGFGLYLAYVIAFVATYLLHEEYGIMSWTFIVRVIFVLILFTVVKKTKNNIVKYIIYGYFALSFISSLSFIISNLRYKTSKIWRKVCLMY